MTSVRILADDLTGALDASAPFSAASGPISVRWSGQPTAVCGSFSFDGETRRSDRFTAPARVERLTSILTDSDIGMPVPTIETFWARGIDVSGPLPGDTIFVKAVAGQLDAVVAMFRDQGHIPVKLLAFKIDPMTRQWVGLSGVNVTLGLPIIRTSVDHGAAFDIAGKGVANAQSMIEAIDYAARLAAGQRARQDRNERAQAR